MLTVSMFFYSFDPDKNKWLLWSILLVLLYFGMETLRFRAETNCIVELDENIEGKYPGVLKTIVWIPSFFQSFIANSFRYDHKKSKRNNK